MDRHDQQPGKANALTGAMLAELAEIAEAATEARR